ncbi:fatty acid synthase [Trichonephila clavipes]|nr:fatty acid synthase [Trichonephila clavipes]
MRGTFTGQRYVVDILRPHVGPFLNGLPGTIFQQDNARPHTAKVAQDFLRHFQTLPWPARCPDLSPVEHVGDQLKRWMPSCHSVYDLELVVQDLWAHLPQDNIRCLINSLPDRVALQNDLSEVTNQEQKIQTVLDCLTSSCSETINRNEISEALSNCLIKHKICKSYIPKKKLSMDINIIENSTKLLANDVSLVKESFEKVCTKKISVHRVLYTTQSSNEEEFRQLTKILLTIV